MNDHDAKDGRHADEFRTSSQYSLSPSQTDTLLALSRRVQRLTRLPVTHVEQIQVLRYLEGQHYSSHHDFFDPADYSSRGGRERGLASNRLATVFFYLNDVPTGGQTAFPRAGGLEQPSDFRDCTRGLAVTPSKRRVAIFYSMLPSGEFDHYSLHNGCDVGRNATKWAANYWIWNTPQQSTLLHPSLRRFEEDLQAEDPSEILTPGGAAAHSGLGDASAAAAATWGPDGERRRSRLDRFG